jgi:transcription antitermination factor NusG
MLEKQELEAGDLASVYSGPMMGMKGKVVEVQQNMVLLQIPSLGLNLQVKVQSNNIKLESKMHA